MNSRPSSKETTNRKGFFLTYSPTSALLTSRLITEYLHLISMKFLLRISDCNVNIFSIFMVLKEIVYVTSTTLSFTLNVATLHFYFFFLLIELCFNFFFFIVFKKHTNTYLYYFLKLKGPLVKH